MRKKIFHGFVICLCAVSLLAFCTGCSAAGRFTGQYRNKNSHTDTIDTLTINEDNTYIFQEGEGAAEQTGKAEKGARNEAAVAYGTVGPTLNMKLVLEGVERDVTIARDGDGTLRFYVTMDSPHGKTMRSFVQVSESSD